MNISYFLISFSKDPPKEKPKEEKKPYGQEKPKEEKPKEEKPKEEKNVYGKEEEKKVSLSIFCLNFNKFLSNILWFFLAFDYFLTLHFTSYDLLTAIKN